MSTVSLGLLVAVALAAVSSAADQPNIVFIFADDLGFNDIGFRNSEVISPNLDALATQEGMILDQNYVIAVCTPSRHTMLSGKYPYKTRMQHGVLADPMPQCTPTNIPYLGSYLRDLGYSTHLAGKWHLGYCQEACLPTNRGFDTFTGLWTGMGKQFIHTSSTGGYDFRANEDLDYSSNGTHTTDVIRDSMVDIINANDGTPMFLMMTFTAVHTPHDELQEYIDMYPELLLTNTDRAKYLGMMTHMDSAIGDVVQALKDKSLWDNTIFVFTADNGGEDGGFADNSPLRGSKASLWEGGARVTGFVSGGLVQAKGTVAEGMIHEVDWAPTFISMAGGTPDASMDGVDQTDMVLNNGDSNRDEIIYNIDNELFGDNYKDDQGPLFGQAAIRQGAWKLIWGPEGFTDGYGLSVTRYWQIKANQDLVGWTGTSPVSPAPTGPRPIGSPCTGARPGHERERRSAYSYTEDELYLQRAISEAKMFSPDDINSGLHHLFNLEDDPYEMNDLGQDAGQEQRVLDMKQRILDLITEGYQAPNAADFQISLDSLPCHFQGAAGTGWCADSDFTL